MDQSARRLPDPVAASPHGERRRYIRHKLHTPVYASFNGPQAGMVVDLSELLDLHEDGFAVQTSEPLEVNRAVTLCLDLPETKSYIHGSGQVIWSDDTGRGGIRFCSLPESSRQILKQWLFVNLLIACSNHAARTEQLTQREAEESSELAPSAKPRPAVPLPDRSGLLAAVEAVRREIRETGDDVDVVLQLVTDRALTLTGASGAALAFLTDDQMICRARAGEPAPPLGTPVNVRDGLSGECVRTDLLVSCQDTENDPRVDPELCRALGIGSMMAAPIVSYLRVVGLLEVFSPHPHGFAKVHEAVLDRLVEIIPKAYRENTQSEKTETPLGPDLSQPISGPIVPEQAPEQNPEPAPKGRSRFSNLVLLGLVVAVATVLGYIVGPMILRRDASSAQAPQQLLVEAATPPGQSATDQRSAVRRPQPKSLADLRKLAAQGDADAQWQMGVRFHNGEGVPHDDAQAIQWFRRAAEQGHVTAQATLGAYYWAGRGVPQDLSQAYFWSALALAQGDENSKSRLEGLASQMTRAQVSAARQRAEVWIHQHNSARPAGN
ncbi:MAG: GAF domain-containing protein [Acidobacteriia bacterium]|nr:GAF domain-containing protein [Terriglobia bacterium]